MRLYIASAGERASVLKAGLFTGLKRGHSWGWKLSSERNVEEKQMRLKNHKKAMKAYREHSENLTDEEILERLWEASEGVHIEKINPLAWRGVAIILNSSLGCWEGFLS